MKKTILLLVIYYCTSSLIVAQESKTDAVFLPMLDLTTSDDFKNIEEKFYKQLKKNKPLKINLREDKYDESVKLCEKVYTKSEIDINDLRNISLSLNIRVLIFVIISKSRTTNLELRIYDQNRDVVIGPDYEKNINKEMFNEQLYSASLKVWSMWMQNSVASKSKPTSNKKVMYEEKVKAGAFTHDGFFFRGTLGLGSSAIEESFTFPSGSAFSYKLDGFTVSIDTYFGFSLFNSLILYGVIGSSTTARPNASFTLDGVAVFPPDPVNYTLSLTRVGGGFSYYIMPANFYFSFDLSSGYNSIEENNQVSKTDKGLIYKFSIGKEWWVTEDWGLGLAPYYYFGNTIDTALPDGQTPVVKNYGYGVAFTATYN